jgi:hypothetical protein
MTEMKIQMTGLALAALLTVGSALPGFAEDAAPAKSAPVMADPPPAKTEAPTSVPRPSLAPKTAEPAQAPAPETEAAPRAHRRYAHRRHWGYRTAYWEPFPIYWPHMYHHRIHWNRIPWMFRF